MRAFNLLKMRVTNVLFPTVRGGSFFTFAAAGNPLGQSMNDPPQDFGVFLDDLVFYHDPVPNTLQMTPTLSLESDTGESNTDHVTKQTSPDFEWSSGPPGTNYQWRVGELASDGSISFGAWNAPQSTTTATATLPGGGIHVFSVRPIDSQGLVGKESSRGVQVDVINPAFSRFKGIRDTQLRLEFSLSEPIVATLSNVIVRDSLNQVITPLSLEGSGTTTLTVVLPPSSTVNTKSVTLSGATDVAGNLLADVSITSVNDPASIGAFDTAVVYTENAAAMLLDADATVTDIDSTNLNAGILTVSIDSNSESADRLEIRQQGTAAGQIGLSGANVRFGATTIGTFTGGAGAVNLVITLNANATMTAVQALLQNITYRSVSTNPSMAPRTVRVAIVDVDGGMSNRPTKTIYVNNAPVITGPTSITSAQRPLISWASVPGATEYEIWVAKAPGTVAYHRVTVTVLSYTPPLDFGIGTFNLWVKAKNSLASGPWSPKYSFAINTAVAPKVITRLQPTLRPTITWNVLPGAVKYDVWIDDVSRGVSQKVRNTNVVGASFTPSSDLPLGVYKAWIRGIAADTTVGKWSSAIEFVTAQPPVVTQGQNATFDRTPTLAWNSLSGAAKYEVFIRNQSTGATTLEVRNIAGLSFTPSSPLSDGPYRWWVLGVSAQGVRSFWTAPVDLYVGGRSQLLSPVGSTGDRTPTFTWRPVDGAVRYDLFVNHVGGQSQIIRQQNLTGTSYTPGASLPTGIYRAWIRAVSSTGELGPWSHELAFTVATHSAIEDSNNPAGVPDAIQGLLAGENPDLEHLSPSTGSKLQIDTVEQLPTEDLVRSRRSYRPVASPTQYEPLQPEHFDELVVSVMNEILERA